MKLLSYIEKHGDDKAAIAGVVLRYALGMDNAYTCQEKLKPLCKNISAQKFRLGIAENAYYTLNIRFMVLNVAKRRGNITELFREGYHTFEVEPKDAKMLYLAYIRDGRLRADIKKFAKQFKMRDIDGKSFSTIYQRFHKIHPEIMRHIRHKVFTKLRFICGSTNTEFHDFNMELMCKAMQTYIRMMPTDKSDTHVANFIRSAINNHVINMIKRHTAQKRARLLKGESDGFGGNNHVMMEIAENQMFRSLGADETVSYESLRNTDDSSEEVDRLQSTINYSRLLKSYGTTPKRRRLIQLVALTECTQFSSWLRVNAYTTGQDDNVDYHDSVGQDAYMVTVCAYLKISVTKAQAFMQRLGDTAYPEYRNGGVQ